MSNRSNEIAALGKDLHYLGVANSVEIPTKLYEMGWRKAPREEVVITNVYGANASSFEEVLQRGPGLGASRNWHERTANQGRLF